MLSYVETARNLDRDVTMGTILMGTAVASIAKLSQDIRAQEDPLNRGISATFLTPSKCGFNWWAKLGNSQQ